MEILYDLRIEQNRYVNGPATFVFVTAAAAVQRPTARAFETAADEVAVGATVVPHPTQITFGKGSKVERLQNGNSVIN
ncbi:MAG: hypothetical protein EZS28_008047 [Streblomastix strix]|uniref:Uncharacterized protein n=1 Tax=Streblomastix strix TaxID=222440 RepID=A0A5J4WPW7_9EUKA|nr:MAG: hypothetical protein EZS28_008047 [Streblomastix strix]